MAISALKRRSRMLSFRLSEEEYSDLKAICEAQGARSVSDLARIAILNLAGGGNSNGHSHLHTEMDSLKARVATLDDQIQRLSRLLVSRGETEEHEQNGF